jgi:uncharacterized protein (TIGR03435 family)
MKTATFVLLLALPAYCDVKPGDTAPVIHLQAFVPSQPVDAAIASLKGKAIVLEFWATWCAPCVGAIPHLNELVGQFAGKPIQFISVTDEDPGTVAEFLKKHPIDSLVGTDKDKVMHKAFGFRGIPDMVLIGADGKLVGIIHPGQLQVSYLEDLAAGRSPKLPVIPDVSISRSDDSSTAGALLDVIVRPSTSDETGSKRGPNSLQAKGITIKRLMSAAYQVPISNVVGEMAEDSIRYDIALNAPGTKPEAFRDMTPQILCFALHISARKETQDTDGWILTAPNGKPAGLVENNYPGPGRAGKGQVDMAGVPLARLTDMLGRMLEKPILDKTGLTGRYDVKFEYDGQKPETMIEGLRGLGLTVTAGKIPTEYLRVSKQ